MKHELQPLSAPFPDDVSAALAQYPQGKDGYLLKLFRTFANSMRFLAGKGVVNLLDENSPLSLREREIVILRTTAKNQCEYEWGVHVAAFARAAGLNDRQVSATCIDDETVWGEKELTLLRCVDDLCTQATIGDSNYEKFQHFWTKEQQLEILALCGNYHTVSFVANASRLDLESFGKTFPE